MHVTNAELAQLRHRWTAAKDRVLKRNDEFSHEKLRRAYRVANAMDEGFEHLTDDERRDANYRNISLRIAALS